MKLASISLSSTPAEHPSTVPRVVLAHYRRHLTAAEREFAVGIPAPVTPEHTPWWLWMIAAGWLVAFLVCSTTWFNDPASDARAGAAYYSESSR